MTYKQRLTLQVFAAADSRMDSKHVSFPYGFDKYAKVASKCKGKKLEANPLYLGNK